MCQSTYADFNSYINKSRYFDRFQIRSTNFESKFIRSSQQWKLRKRSGANFERGRCQHDGYIEIVQLLMENGSNVDVANNGNYTPLMATAYNGHVDVVKLLIELGSQTDFGETRRRDCVPRGCHVHLVGVLFKNGSPVDSIDEEGWTPLMTATWKGRLDIVKY